MSSAKILSFLIISTFFLQFTNQSKQIRGSPEVDYPTYYAIPTTSFRCSDQLYNPGFYADTETRCQVFHLCYEHRQESFLCPMGTIFNQPILACDYWYSSNCSLAPSYYHVNADKRNDYFDEADDPVDREPEDLFDKISDLYEVSNKTPDLPVLKNNSDIPETELLDRDGIESSGEPLIEKNNKSDDYNKYNYDNQASMVDEEHPEIVKYEIGDLNVSNVYKGSENEKLDETEKAEDFIFSEDGMLHPNREDIYEIHSTDINFDQEYSGYAEVPSKENFNDDLNEDLDLQSNFQLSDFELQKRNADIKGHFRRPSSRKPIIISEEPEIVPLPVLKQKRKLIGIASAVGTTEDAESLYDTNDSNIYKDAASVVNKGLEVTTSIEFPLDELSSELNSYELRDPKLFYEIQGDMNDENDSQLHQTDSLSVIYDYSTKKNRNEYVLSNDEENISSFFGSGSNDLHDFSNAEYRSTLVDSNYGDESEIFIENFKSSTILPGKSSEATAEDESSFDSDPFLGSGSEKNTNQPHSSNGFSFPEDQDIFSDSEDVEIDGEKSYVLPMNLFDTSEGSGISVQEAAGVPDFIEDHNGPTQIILKDDSEGSIEYGKESSYSSKAFGKFSPLEGNEEVELPDGSGETSELNLLHKLHESSDGSQEASVKGMPEIREIDGSYYVYSDSEFDSNYEYDGSSGFYSENVDYPATSSFEDGSDKATEELINNEEFHYIPADSKLLIDNIGNGALHTIDYQDSGHLENTYEKLSDEFEAETSSDIPEDYIVDDSESAKHLSAEDLKYFEIVSQNQSPMLKNLFDVSNEKSSHDDIKDKMHPSEIITPKQYSGENAATHEDTDGMEDVYEFENISPDSFSDNEHSVDTEFSDMNSEINAAEKMAEDVSNAGSSDQNGSVKFISEQNLEAFVSGKEADPFSPLSKDSYKISLDGPESKKKLSLKFPPIKPKNFLVNPAVERDLKEVARGKRLNDNLQTFNPLNRDDLMVPSRETFREAMFRNIPSAFLKMKHSSLRPYFYNSGLKNSGFNPRTGDSFESSKLSKLTSLGKKLLAGKRAKFNRMKKYIDSYRI